MYFPFFLIISCSHTHVSVINVSFGSSGGTAEVNYTPDQVVAVSYALSVAGGLEFSDIRSYGQYTPRGEHTVGWPQTHRDKSKMLTRFSRSQNIHPFISSSWLVTLLLLRCQCGHTVKNPNYHHVPLSPSSTFIRFISETPSRHVRYFAS